PRPSVQRSGWRTPRSWSWPGATPPARSLRSIAAISMSCGPSQEVASRSFREGPSGSVERGEALAFVLQRPQGSRREGGEWGQGDVAAVVLPGAGDRSVDD